MLRVLLAAAALALAAPAAAQQLPRELQPTPRASDAPRPSICQAIARTMPRDLGVRLASLDGNIHLAEGLSPDEVSIRFDNHSTYLIETAGGQRIATDYNGYLRNGGIPTIATMNRAHSTHHTYSPDPGIAHVLPGWGAGEPARHHLTVGDVTVRNVTTDIIRYATQPDGNSIFIFEVAGLCIGHLGHLHHALTESHFAAIGRLDVVMVPVDGGLTLAHATLRDMLKRLRSSVVLPMHLRGYDPLPRFLSHIGADMAITRLREPRLILSMRTLPRQPTVVLLPDLR